MCHFLDQNSANSSPAHTFDAFANVLPHLPALVAHEDVPGLDTLNDDRFRSNNRQHLGDARRSQPCMGGHFRGAQRVEAEREMEQDIGLRHAAQLFRLGSAERLHQVARMTRAAG